MADNANVTAGDGTIVVATDKIGGVDYQRVKMTWGADGTASDVEVAAPMPVVQTGTPGLPTGAATSAKQDTQITAEQAILAKLIAAPATEAKQDTGNTSVAAINTAIGAAADVAATADTGTFSLIAITKRIVAKLTSIVTALGSPFQAGGSIGNTTFASTQSGTWTAQIGNTQNTTPILASPLATAIDVTLTRPNDTTTYAANDELTDTGAAIRTITSAARASGGYVRLMSATLVCSANVATKPQIVAYLFDTTSTPATDNAAFDSADSVLNTVVGILPFNVWYPGNDASGASGNAASPYLGPPLEMKTAGSANLFVRYKMLNAYVPTAQEVFILRLVFAQY